MKGRENVKLMESAGKHETSGKHRKMCGKTSLHRVYYAIKRTSKLKEANMQIA